MIFATLLFSCVGAFAKTYTRVSVEIYADSKQPVSRIIFPIGAKYNYEFSADQLDSSMENEFVAKGNARIVIDRGNDITTLTGSEIHLVREILDEEKFVAITDLEKMAESDQRYRKIAGFLGNAKLVTLQTKIDDSNHARLQDIVSQFGWPGTKFAGAKGGKPRSSSYNTAQWRMPGRSCHCCGKPGPLTIFPVEN